MFPLSRFIICFSALVYCQPVLSFAQDQPSAERPATLQASVTAELWPYEPLEKISSKVAFEKWRAQAPKEKSQALVINGLSIPAREKTSIVHVSGILDAPITGNYRFYIYATGKNPNAQADATELWIYDDDAGVWKLAQTSDNPFGREGRTSLVKGKPRRFELFTIGQSAVSVDWELRAYIPESKTYGLLLDRQLVPSAALKVCASENDDGNGIGPSASWKKSAGLKTGKSIGPDSPWGDPDGDGILNWQEQKHELNPLKADSKGASGMVLWEIWRNIPGGYVFDLRRAAHFPTGEREVRYLDRLIIPSGQGNHYGSRLRGFLIAPVDGKYTFKLRAEDSAELWLGTNDKWQTKRIIARTGERAGQRGLAPQLAEVSLKAGQKYYLEVLHKQDTGTDFCTVAWITPGETQTRIISSKYLSAWQPCPTDTEDDGLPDEWQRSSGLLDAGVANYLRHSEADADFDGVNNRDEWIAGTSPRNATDFPSQIRMLTCHGWTGLPGNHIESLLDDPNFPARPQSSNHIDNLDFNNEGDNYGLRIRGYLTPPEDGEYTFSISGNNAAILYLGTSEDKFTKAIVSRVEAGINWRSFQKDRSQVSAPISLKKGKQYYIEVIYKRGEKAKHHRFQMDHSSVAWATKGKSFSVISADCFTPYQPSKSDLDDDDLPDDWEKRYELDSSQPSGKNGAWGDPDGDGLENFREFQLGLSPVVPDVHGIPNLALWEVWYSIEGLIPAMREGEGLAAAMSEASTFPLKPSRQEWRSSLDAARCQGTNLGARLRAHIIAPVTGEYSFSISGRDVGELYLSTDASKFKRQKISALPLGTGYQQWENHPNQATRPVHLEAGKMYYIEALYARGSFPFDDDFFSIGWKLPGAKSFEVINSKHLIAFHRDPNDQDDDDLPDDWETRYGLDSTDPRGENGPFGDPDRDRITNAEELRLGTNPNSRDTDGDGISDYDEIHIYRKNPTVKDTIPPIELQNFPLASAQYPRTTWMVGKNGALTSVNRRGTLSFEFDLETAGFCVLEIEASSLSASAFNPPIPFFVILNGRNLGSADASANRYASTWLTQWLPVGKHTVTIDNRNLRAGSSLALHSVKLLKHQGEDYDKNSIPDWLENHFYTLNNVQATTRSSKTSPACIEGRARSTEDVLIAVSGKSISANAGIGACWYANLPLSKDHHTSFEVKFENGSISQSLNIQWEETNLLECPDELKVRVGDTLKVSAPSAHPSKPELVTNNDKPVDISEDIGCGFVTFDSAGIYTLKVSSADLPTRLLKTVNVRVYDADFGKTFDVASGTERKWYLPGISRDLHLQADPILTLREIQTATDQSRCVGVASKAKLAASPVVLARLSENGPIISSTKINSFFFAASTVTNNSSILRVLPDGTRVVRAVYVIDGVIPADLSIWIEMYVTDAVFANGDTWWNLTAADFNERGEAIVDYYKAPGSGTPFICHWIRPYLERGDETTE